MDGPYQWQMPQGGIDPGEDPEAAARRELFEETNVPAHALRLLGEVPEWLSYDLPGAVAQQAWKGRYRGQTQRWFAYGFTGPDSLIDVACPGGGAHKPEFAAWRWAPFAELPGLVIPFKRPSTRRWWRPSRDMPAGRSGRELPKPYASCAAARRASPAMKRWLAIPSRWRWRGCSSP